MKWFYGIKSSLRAKVTCTLLVGLLISLSILGILDFYHARSILVSDAEENLVNKANAYANEISMWRDLRKSEIDILAHNQSIVSGDTNAALAYLREEANRNPIYSRFWLVDLKGQAIHTTGDKTNIADRDYFKKVLATGVVDITDPVISKVDGKMVVSVVAPIRQGNVTVGVLGGTVMVDSLIARINQIQVGQSGYAYVVQGDGLIIIHPDKNLVMKTNLIKDEGIDKNLQEITKDMVEGRAGISGYDWNGQKKYTAYAPVRDCMWSLAVNVPEAEVLTKITPFALTSLLTIILILGVTCVLVVVASRRFTKPIVILNQAVEKVAQGDLTIFTAAESGKAKSSKDEMDTLSDNFRLMVENLRKIVRQVSGAAEQVAASSEELTASADQAAQAANQVAESITKVASGADEQLKIVNNTTETTVKMSDGVQQAAINAEKVATAGEKTSQAAQNGGQAIDDAVTQMASIEKSVTNSADVVSSLGNRSKEIGQIIDTIAGIAGQTNLLALNAAIEAARAGEQGKGFAVVAEEVRKLAEQSQDAAKQIAEIIGEIQGDTDKAVQAMAEGTQEVRRGTEIVDAAGKTFGEITALVKNVTDQVQDISTGIQQIAVGSQQIVTAVKHVDQISKETAGQSESVSAATEEQSASMQEIASSSQALAAMAEELRTVVAHFKI